MSTKTYVGTVRYRDIGAGEYYLDSLDGNSTSYRLMFPYTDHALYDTLNTHSIAGDITTLQGSASDADVQVAGGTSFPILTVQSAE